MPNKPRKKAPDARGEATRERIVSAAVAVFSEKGFEAASTRAIAQRAKADQGLLTYHFPRKDDLWRAAADRIFGILNEALDERVLSLEFADSRDRARAAIREFVHFAAAHPELFRFLVDCGNRSDAQTRWLTDTHLKPRFEFMRTHGVVHAAGIDESLAPHAFYALVGAASLIFAVAPNCRRLSGLDPRKPEAVEAHANFIAQLIVP
jgi:TetR/AcrR family transcriptional regulator